MTLFGHVAHAERNLHAEVVGLQLEVLREVLDGSSRLLVVHESVCLHEHGVAVLRIDGEREVGGLQGIGVHLQGHIGLCQQVPCLRVVGVVLQDFLQHGECALVVVESHAYLGLHDGKARVSGVGVLEYGCPFLGQFPLVVVHEDGRAVVEEGVQAVLHQLSLFVEERRCLLCASLLNEYFGANVHDFAVLLLGDAVDDGACFVELAVEHLLPGQEDLRVGRIGMHVDGRLYGLVGFLVLLASHVVFGNVGQFVCLQIGHVPFGDSLLVAMQEPEKVPRLVVSVVIFHCLCDDFTRDVD